MTDVAGVVLGVVALWETCVRIFDTIEASQKYGMDYEILCVKLEVERIRLLNWGEAVGIGIGDEPQALVPHPDLSKDHVKLAVTRVLGCIKSTFEGTELLQTKYGLELATTPQGEATEAAGRLLLGSVFKESYERLRNHARDRQKGTPVRRRTLWAIKDKAKFGGLIVEIRGFNDALESLFRGARESTERRMIQDISSSENTAGLQLVQEATAGEHHHLSEQASARIETLTTGRGSTARTELMTDDLATISLAKSEPDEADWESVKDNESVEGEIKTSEAKAAPRELSEWEKRAGVVDVFARKKRKGSLVVSLHAASEYSSRVSTWASWEGESADPWESPWTSRSHGYVTSKHAAFSPYWKKRYMHKYQRDQLKYDHNTEEGGVLFNVESYPKYDHVYPGTLTLEGFSLEGWTYEETHHPKGDRTVLVSCADPGSIEGKQLLRRIHELQTSLPKWGWAPDEDRENLIEFMGPGEMYGTGYGRDLYFSKFFSWLNRTDVFVDFRDTSSVGAVWSTKGMSSFWNMLWQIIVGYEMKRRLENKTEQDSGYTFGFTPRVLATVIISDAFISNVELVVADMKIAPSEWKKPETPENGAKADDFKVRGNEAMAKKDFDKAIELYTEAIKIDTSNAVYRCNRSAALYEQGKFELALEDAYISTRLDPKYSKAWSRFGAACLKTGRPKKAEEAYNRASQLQSGPSMQVIQKGLAQAKQDLESQLDAIGKETDKSKKHRLRNEYLSQDWDTLMMLKHVNIHSKVHAQQVEGLLCFAELMRWPYINETREFAEEAYSELRGGKTIPIDLHDWLYGLVLPGKWFAYKIMAALICCTPSLAKPLGVALYMDCGLSTPTKSYWRIPTVLGKVLGCLPVVQSLCGWLGPCPPVEFDPPLEAGTECRHVRLKSRQVTPVSGERSDVIELGGDLWRDTSFQGDEELSHWIEQLTDPNKWLVPEPPVKEVSTCTLKTIRLKRDLSANEQDDDDENLVYRAQLLFQMDDNNDLIRFSLFTNPLFVSLPPCHPGAKGAHEVHLRELHRYDHKHVWTVERLKSHTAEASEESEVIIINATGSGSELLARAWCSERGKNAVIRKAGGPCYTCTVRAAGRKGLRAGVVIWVSSD